jgi:hypothetical protein
MSGGGGGRYYPSQDFDNCQTISIQTSLASPVPAVIGTLSVGDILDIALLTATGPAQVITNAGAIAGALLPPELSRLIRCMNEGHQYTAKVTAIAGGNCEILIRHK